MKLAQTTLVKLTKIQPNNWNTNRMDTQQFERLKLQIQKKGFIDPVDVIADKDRLQTDKLVILDGYHRYKAAKQLKLKEIPCIIYSSTDFTSQTDMEMFGMTKNRLKGEDDKQKLKERVELWMEQENIEVWDVAETTGLNEDSLNFLITEDYTAFMEQEEQVKTARQKTNLPFLGMYLPTDLAHVKIDETLKQHVIDFIRQFVKDS